MNKNVFICAQGHATIIVFTQEDNKIGYVAFQCAECGKPMLQRSDFGFPVNMIANA